MSDKCEVCNFPLDEMIHEPELCKLRAAAVAKFYEGELWTPYEPEPGSVSSWDYIGIDPATENGDWTVVSIGWNANPFLVMMGELAEVFKTEEEDDDT